MEEKSTIWVCLSMILEGENLEGMLCKIAPMERTNGAVRGSGGKEYEGKEIDVSNTY